MPRLSGEIFPQGFIGKLARSKTTTAPFATPRTLSRKWNLRRTDRVEARRNRLSVDAFACQTKFRVRATNSAGLCAVCSLGRTAGGPLGDLCAGNRGRHRVGGVRSDL